MVTQFSYTCIGYSMIDSGSIETPVLPTVQVGWRHFLLESESISFSAVELESIKKLESESRRGWNIMAWNRNQFHFLPWNRNLICHWEKGS